MKDEPRGDAEAGSGGDGYGDDDVGDGLASVIAVDRADDIAAICGRLDSAPTYAVVVHAPRGNRQLATELGMRRLVRHAEESGRVMAVATRSSSLANRARQAGVPTSRRPENVRWDSGGHRVIGLGRWSFVSPSFGAWFQYLSIIIVFGVLGAVALAVGPSARVVVSSPTETVTKTVSIRAATQRTEVDVDGLRLPAREVTGIHRLTVALAATGAPVAGSTAKTVSAADVAAATALVEQMKTAETLKQVAQKARPFDAVIVRTVVVTVKPPTIPAVGTAADLLLFEVEIEVKATAIPQDVLEEVARKVLTPPGGGEFVPGSVRAVEDGPTAIDDEGVIIARLAISARFTTGLATGELKDAVKGKSEESAESILRERYGIEEPEVRLSPGWSPWLPRFAFRITVELRGTTDTVGTSSAPGTGTNATPTRTPTPGATASP